MNVRLKLDLQIRLSSSEEHSLKVCLSKQHLLGIYVNWTSCLQMEYDGIENDSTVWTWIWRILEVKDWFSGISVAIPSISTEIAKGLWRSFWVGIKVFWGWKTFQPAIIICDSSWILGKDGDMIFYCSPSTTTTIKFWRGVNILENK